MSSQPRGSVMVPSPPGVAFAAFPGIPVGLLVRAGKTPHGLICVLVCLCLWTRSYLQAGSLPCRPASPGPLCESWGMNEWHSEVGVCTPAEGRGSFREIAPPLACGLVCSGQASRTGT